MKVTKLITCTLLLTLLVSGCSKENDGRIRIFAENMRNSSKVEIDPSDLSISWVSGEYINFDIDGTPKTAAIAQGGNASDPFYVDLGENTNIENKIIHAIYPNTINGVEVKNTDTKREVVLNRLPVVFNGTKSKVVFPMYGSVNTAESHQLLFNHLSAGFKLTLTNSGSEKSVAWVEVIARSESDEVTNLGVGDVKASWAVEGPSVPVGSVGGIQGDVVVKYTSDMYFDLSDGTHEYVTIAQNDTRSFCVPVTISKLKHLTVIGYGTTGDVVFAATKSFASDIALSAANMYTIPTIDINNTSK